MDLPITKVILSVRVRAFSIRSQAECGKAVIRRGINFPSWQTEKRNKIETE